MGDDCWRQKFTRRTAILCTAFLWAHAAGPSSLAEGPPASSAPAFSYSETLHPAEGTIDLNLSGGEGVEAPYAIDLIALKQPESLPNPEGDIDVSGGEGEGDKPKDELDNLMDMDLDQLQTVDVVEEFTPAALTEVPNDRNIVPAAVTRITKEDIWRSGARNLDELLDIFVPNFEIVKHHWEQQHLGLRGIISDREDKYLLLVNNRIMNDKTHYGAASERLLPELDDIDHVDVVRGPGSAVYGPGAVSMVIAIYTDTAETFTGTKARVRGGMIDSFSSLELKHGAQWKNAEGGILLYGGIGSQDGADQWDAPLVLGTSDPGYPGFGNETVKYQGYQAGDRVGNPINRNGQSFQNNMPLKFFADVTYNDWEVWARYTRSGVQFPLAPAAGLHFPNGFGTFVAQDQSEAGNQQVTVQSKYETEINDDLRFLYMLGWDSSEFARNLFFGTAENYSEQELNTRAIFIHDLDEHQIAIGGEFYNDWYGLPGHLLSGPVTIGRLGPNVEAWQTQTYSILGEDQWQVTDEWTIFMGGRWDKNTYTPWMYSPRAAVVYTPDEYTAWKFIANRSQRMNFAEELRAQWLANRTLSDPEILRSYELRYEQQETEKLWWAVSAFYIDLDAISWNGTTSSSAITGNQTQWGLEGELRYDGDCWYIIGSHSYTKLLTFTLFDPTVTTFITAAPNGFGDDLSAWSPHITKIFARRQLTQVWAVDGSLRYYWGYPGSADIVHRTNATPGAFAQTAPNWNRPWEESVFLNLGVEYRYSRNTRFRVDGYNLLGAFDQDLNHRNFYGDNSFVNEAVAIGVSGEMLY
jgi:outer membrane receptor protein involved in Fe transport